MGTQFDERPIEDLCTRVTSGATPLRSRPEYYEGGTIDWFKTGELNDGFLEASAEKVTPRALEETAIKLLPAGTVLMAMYGDGRTITTLAMLRKPATTNQACVAMLVDPAKCDDRYFFYALKSKRHLLIGLAMGGAQRNLSAKVVKAFSLPVPPLTTQRRISGILSAYDDLIENCERRVRVLDEMARALYREWFVHFRYPGHEKVPLVDSALGRIPKGWRAAALSSVTSFLSRGISPSYDDKGPSTIINQKCIRDQRLDMSPTRRQSKPIPEERRVRAGDILVNSTGVGTLGRVAQVLGDVGTCTADTHVTIIRADDATDSAFLGAALLALQPTFERKGVGATGQTELSRTAIGEVVIAVPPTERQRAFAEVVRPIRAESLNLQNQASNLRRTRDLLLPRLLSGQLSVDDA